MDYFRHYIVTRFNVGLYDPSKRRSPLFSSVDQWMLHRIGLFKSITLPSIAGQSCQNFTWLVLMDSHTPQPHKSMLEEIDYPNMRLVYIDGEGLDNSVVSRAILRNIAAGRYDLITTRIDNDDAFHIHTVRNIQYWYAKRPEPWTIVFPNGLILDLPNRKLYPMVYPHNNCPTLIENSTSAKTVYCAQHGQIQTRLQEHLVDNFYWLQVVHSKNIVNSVTAEDRREMIYKDKPLSLEILRNFNIDPAFLTQPESKTISRKVPV